MAPQVVLRDNRRRRALRLRDEHQRPGGLSPGYGRGSFETALRTARALTDRPISASSAAAWTAVPSRSVPRDGTGLRRAGCPGVPAGCAGWWIRDGRGLVWPARGPAGCGPPTSRCFGFGFGPARAGRAAVVDGLGAGFVSAVAAWSAGFASTVAGCSVPLFGSDWRAPRLSLRRCGRVRGSAPRTSEGCSSLISTPMIAHGGWVRRRPDRRQLLNSREIGAKSRRNLKRTGPLYV
jgi:hypothetical protein